MGILMVQHIKAVIVSIAPLSKTSIQNGGKIDMSLIASFAILKRTGLVTTSTLKQLQKS